MVLLEWQSIGMGFVDCKTFWKSMKMYFSVQHKISCVRLQYSYMLDGTLLQKQI